MQSRSCATGGGTIAVAMDNVFNLQPDDEREGKITAWALAWFPAEEWSKAIVRWPELLDNMPEDHEAYCHRIELNLRAAAAKEPGSPDVAPLNVDALTERFGDDAGEPLSRATLGATLARNGEAMSWPPGRNDTCWCQSGRKYKQCCLRATAS